MNYAPHEEKDVHYAYNSIHTFFNNFDLRDTQKRINDILFAADSHTMAKQGDPADVLYFMEALQGLCSAAFVIHCSRYIRTEAVIAPSENGGPDISAGKDFLRHSFCTAWDSFPRNLSTKQYYNPYKAIKKFCKYMTDPEWKQALKECTEYALKQFPIGELEPAYSLLAVRLHLQRLVEACHLLDVRTNMEKATPGEE